MYPVDSHPELKRWIDDLAEKQATTPSDDKLAAVRRYWLTVSGEAMAERQIERLTGEEPDIPAGAMDWIGHLSWLSGLLDAGCVFHLDDLCVDEWEGLRLWRAAEARVRAKYVGCEGCGAGIRPDAEQHFCGWRRKKS